MCKLESPRLLLRPPEPGDAAFFAESLADYDLAKMLATAPHPYDLADAEGFIARITKARALGEAHVFTILTQDGTKIGCCGLHLKNGRYELGYWIAKPFWRQGYASEAARRLLAYGFGVLKADAVQAGWFHDNPGSHRVLARLGFEADHVEACECFARAESVLCNQALLTRDAFGRKKPSEMMHGAPAAPVALAS